MENEFNEQVQPGLQREEELKINQYKNPISHSFEEPMPDDKLKADLISMERQFQAEERSAGRQKKILRGPQLYKEHTDAVKKNIEELQAAAQRDSLKAYLTEKTQKNLASSSWLSKQAFPSEEELDKEMDKAAETVFGTAAISKSQRTKRGQKFKEKAKLQAKMMNELNAFIWKREAAMDEALKIGSDSALVNDITAEAIQTDTEGERIRIGRSKTSFAFFHQSSGALEKNARLGVMAKDIAMFELFKDESVLQEGKKAEFHKKAKETALILSNMYNKKETYQEQALKILQDFKELDLSRFEYQSNEDFLAGEGVNSFAGRFAALRMYSHSLTLLIDLKKYAKDGLEYDMDALKKLTGEDNPEQAIKAYEELCVKAELVREILQDYESRSLLIQSPYFALLASKDADDLSIEDLEKRRDTTEDEAAKQYLTELIHQRRRKGFTRGKSAREIYKERLEKAKEKKQEEPVKAVQHKETDKMTGDLRDELQKSTKFFGDSSLMKAVKRDFLALEALEKTKVTAADCFDLAANLERAYRKAIESCDAYLADRKGDSKTAKERKDLVERARKRCMDNLKLLSTAEMLSGTGRLTFIQDQTDLYTIIQQTYLITGLTFLSKDKKAIDRERTEFLKSGALSEFSRFLKPDTKTVRKGKEAKQYADEIGKLRAELKSIPAGKPFSIYLKIAGVQVVFAQDDKGGLTVHYGDAKVHVQESVSDFILLLDHKMIEEQDKMNPQDMEEVIADQNVRIDLLLDLEDKDNVKLKDVQKSAGDIQRASANLARFLELKTGKAAVFFSNLEPSFLRWIALDLIRGADPEVIAKKVEIISRRTEEKTLNTRETLQLIKEAEKKKTEVEEKVIYRKEERQEDQRGWAPEEKKAIELLSDLIFSQETWKADNTLNDPGERLRLMLEKHVDILARLVLEGKNPLQPGLMQQISAKLPQDVGMLMFALLTPIQNLMGTLALLTREGKDVNALKQEINALVAQKNEILMNALKKADADLEESVNAVMNGMQEKIEEKTATLFTAGEPQNVQQQNVQQQNVQQQNVQQQRRLSEQEEKEEQTKKDEQKLKDLMQDSIKGNSGQGLFIKLIFRNYFKSAGTLDKRCMIGSALKNLSTAKQREGLTPDELEKLKKQEDGEFLGGILKGAGPLFQKILQGLPMDGVDESMRTALEDMKSKLAPIPDEIVKAQLFGMVERSGGKINKIEVVKALGAASVGQTFLCKMFGPIFPEEGRNVVVKLLKPDVRNRMMREKKVMLECARNTDTSGGMEATYLGQLSRIEEELDLTIESRNVIMGKIYDESAVEGQEFDQVKSVKLEEQVEPTVNAMMLEMAPGTTVDQYRKELIQKREEREKRIQRTKAEELKGSNQTEMNLKDIAYIERLFEERKDILKDLKTLQKRQGFLVNLARKWVKEGIFGEGFYHGDLHAGNIMIDDEGATVIDFGNATKLSEEQQIQVTRMVAAAAVGDVETYQEGLHALIKPEFEKIYQAQKKELTKKLEEIFALGSSKSAGLRIAVSLLKAQELGIEVPSSIHNFSQCQLRLQNAVEDLITEMDELKKQLEKIDDITSHMDQGRLNFDPFIELQFKLSNGRENEEKPDKTIKRELEDLTLYFRNISFEDLDLQLASLQGNTFYEARLRSLEGGVGTGNSMDEVRTKIRTKLKDVVQQVQNMTAASETVDAQHYSKLDETYIFAKKDSETENEIEEMTNADDREYLQWALGKKKEAIQRKYNLIAETKKEGWDKVKQEAEEKALNEEKEKLKSELRETIMKEPGVIAKLNEAKETEKSAVLDEIVQERFTEEAAKKEAEWEKIKKKAGQKALNKVKNGLKREIAGSIKNDPEFIEELKKFKEQKVNAGLGDARTKLVGMITGEMEKEFKKLKFVVSDSCMDEVSSFVKKFVYGQIDAEAYNTFAAGMDAHIEEKVRTAKGVLEAYYKAKPVFMDEKKDKKEKEQAVSEFLQEYKKIAPYYASEGPMSMMSIRMIRFYLRRQNENEFFKEAIRLAISKWKDEDKDNTPSLEDMYESYTKHTQQEPDNPTGRLLLEDEIVNRIISLSEKKIKTILPEMEEAKSAKVHDFLFVMGETIEQNLKTALDRMGVFKAMQYSKQLQN